MARTPTQILAAIFAITSNGVPQVPDLSSHSSTGVPALTSNFLSEALTQSQQQVSEKTVRWDGAPIKDLVSLDVGKDGVVLLPVIKEGKAASIWNIEGSAFKVSTLGGNKQILNTTQSDLGALSSKPFLIQEGMSCLEFQITGKGDMSSTYAKLEVSIDGGKPQTWSKLAPISSATLQPVKWDLKLLRDKNQGKDIVARVSLVDGSTSELIGVGEGVIVGDTSSATRTVGISKVVDAPFGLPGRLEGLGATDYLVNSLSLYRNESERKNGRALPFGVNNQTVKSIIESLDGRIYAGDMPYIKGEDIDHLACRIVDLVDATVDSSGLKSPAPFLRQWLVAEAICAFMVSEFDDDPILANEKNYQKWKAGIDPVRMLNLDKPGTICSGAASLTRAISRTSLIREKVGLNCYYISGWFKDPSTGSVPEGSNHAWVAFEFEGGVIVPADTVPPGPIKSERRRWRGKKLPGSILPLNRESFEVFNTLRWGCIDEKNDGTWDKKLPLVNPVINISKEQWISRKIPANFNALSNWVFEHPYQ